MSLGVVLVLPGAGLSAAPSGHLPMLGSPWSFSFYSQLWLLLSLGLGTRLGLAVVLTALSDLGQTLRPLTHHVLMCTKGSMTSLPQS